MSLRSAVAKAFGGLPRRFWAIAIGTFINRAGWFVLPFLAIYLTEQRGLSSSRAGIVVSLVGAGLAFGGIIGGIAADRFGRRFTMLFALSVSALLLLLLGAARELVTMGVVAAIYGLVTSMYNPAAAAFVADVVPAPDRARAYGLLNWAVNGGCALGNTFAGLLAGYGFWFLFAGDAGTTLIYAAIIFALIAETKPDTPPSAQRTSLVDALRDREFVMFVGLALVFWTIFHQCLVTVALDMRSKGIPREVYGGCMAINGILIVVLQPWTTPWLQKFRSELVLAGSTLVTGAGFLTHIFADTAFEYAIGIVIWTIGEIGFGPAASAIVAELAPAHLRGRYQGLYTLALIGSIMVAPAVGAPVWEHLGARTLWIGVMAAAAAAAVGQLLIAPARRARVLQIKAAAAAAK